MSQLSRNMLILRFSFKLYRVNLYVSMKDRHSFYSIFQYNEIESDIGEELYA